MKLLFAIIQNDDMKPCTRALIDANISVTRIASTGGFLRGGNTTLMIGVEEARVQDVLDIIKDKSSRRESVVVPVSGIPHSIDSVSMPLNVVVGGATVFVMDVAESHKY